MTSHNIYIHKSTDIISDVTLSNKIELEYEQTTDKTDDRIRK